jgi:hypothetical protein
MAMRFRYKLFLGVSGSSAEEQDFGKPTVEQFSDSFNEGGSWRVKLSAGAVNQQIFLLNIATAKFLAIRTTPTDINQDPISIRIRRNTTVAEEIEIAPFPGTTNKEGLFVLTTNGLTALYASNPGAIDVDLWLYAGGD